MDSYGVVDLGNAWLSVPGAVIWCFFVMLFFAISDKAQTKAGSILSFLLMTGALTAILINLGWFFIVRH